MSSWYSRYPTPTEFAYIEPYQDHEPRKYYGASHYKDSVLEKYRRARHEKDVRRRGRFYKRRQQLQTAWSIVEHLVAGFARYPFLFTPREIHIIICLHLLPFDFAKDSEQYPMVSRDAALEIECDIKRLYQGLADVTVVSGPDCFHLNLQNAESIATIRLAKDGRLAFSKFKNRFVMWQFHCETYRCFKPYQQYCERLYVHDQDVTQCLGGTNWISAPMHNADISNFDLDVDNDVMSFVSCSTDGIMKLWRATLSESVTDKTSECGKLAHEFDLVAKVEQEHGFAHLKLVEHFPASESTSIVTVAEDGTSILWNWKVRQSYGIGCHLEHGKSRVCLYFESCNKSTAHGK